MVCSCVPQPELSWRSIFHFLNCFLPLVLFSLNLSCFSFFAFFYLSWFLSSVCRLPWFPSRSVVEVCKPAHAFSFHCAVNQPDISIDNRSLTKHQERILAWGIHTNNVHVKALDCFTLRTFIAFKAHARQYSACSLFQLFSCFTFGEPKGFVLFLCSFFISLQGCIHM